MATFEQALAIVADKERKYGLTPGLLQSVWDQESGRSLDIGLKGQQLSRGRGHAEGPFQIVPHYHPAADLSSFESQADYAAKLLKDVGVRGYYGEGQAPAGHPTTDEYEREVMSRVETYGYPSGDLATVTEYPGDERGGLMATDTHNMGMFADAMGPSPMDGPQQEPQGGGGFMDKLYGEGSPPPGLLFALSFMMGRNNPQALGGLLQYAMNYGKEQQLEPYQQFQIDKYTQEREREEAQAEDLQRRADQLAEIYGVQTGIHRTPEQVVQARNSEIAFRKATRGGDIGTISPGDYTPESVQTFAQTRNYSDLVPKPGARNRDLLGSTPQGHRAVQDEKGNVVGYEALPGSKEYEKRRIGVENVRRASADVDRMIGLIEEHGTELAGKTSGTMATLYGQILAYIAEAQNKGVLQEGELRDLEKRVTDPSSPKSLAVRTETMIAQYKEVKRILDDKLKDISKGIQPGSRADSGLSESEQQELERLRRQQRF